ncbi:hypothetical protein [Thermosulfuriphilus sp.]
MKLSALVFPITYLRKDFLHLGLTFFDSLKVLSPTEEPPFEGAEELISKGQVNLCVPLPLGQRLPTFKKMIRDLEGWAQMMGRSGDLEVFKIIPREVMEESVSSIKAALKGEPSGTPREDRLLEAQIFLTLAQNLDRRLDELEDEFRRLKEGALRLTEMIIGPEGPSGFNKWVVEPVEVPEKSYLFRERLSAFVNLLFEARGISPEDFLLTDQPEALEILEIACEKKRLPLPYFLYERPLDNGSPRRLKEEDEVFKKLLLQEQITKESIKEAQEIFKGLSFDLSKASSTLKVYVFPEISPFRLLGAAADASVALEMGRRGTLLAIVETFSRRKGDEGQKARQHP